MNIFRFIQTMFLLLFLSGLLPNAGHAQDDGDEPNGDLGLFISCAAVRQRLKQENALLLVDVRAAAHYAELHIPGSIHVPLPFVRTKTFLKSKPIVLVHADLSLKELTTDCRKLRALGFNARILQGGLNAWQAQGGQLTGAHPRDKTLCFFSPSVVFQDRGYKLWQKFDLSLIRSESAARFFPEALHLPFGSGAANAEIIRLATAQKLNPSLNFLVVDHHGVNHAAILEQFQYRGVNNLFFIRDGLKAYENYLNQAVLAGRPQSERIVNRNPCSECSPTAPAAAR